VILNQLDAKGGRISLGIKYTGQGGSACCSEERWAAKRVEASGGTAKLRDKNP